VVVAVIASTLTTIIVFIPFVYLQGTLRAYYLPLAIVVVLSQAASLFVAFSFVPALAAKMLSGKGKVPVAPGSELPEGVTVPAPAPALAGAASSAGAPSPAVAAPAA